MPAVKNKINMTNIMILLLKITYLTGAIIIAAIAAAYVCYCYISVQPVRHEQQYPSADTGIGPRYEADYLTLENFIAKANTLYELEFALQKVKDFKKKYKKHVFSVTLEYDVNELNNHIGNQKIIIVTQPQALN